jgi:2-iminobutanoate/2-iminopropanoate deaminase
VTGTFRLECERVLASVDGVLRAAGCNRTRVVRCTVYLTDLALFGELNEVYAAFFGDHRPARAVVGVSALPRGARVEMEAIALR